MLAISAVSFITFVFITQSFSAIRISVPSGENNRMPYEVILADTVEGFDDTCSYNLHCQVSTLLLYSHECKCTCLSYPRLHSQQCFFDIKHYFADSHII